MPGLLLFLPAFVGGLVVAPVGLMPSGVVGVTVTSVHALVPVSSVHACGAAVLLFYYGYL